MLTFARATFRSLAANGSRCALVIALCQAGVAVAQTAVPATSVDRAKAADIVDPADPAAAQKAGEPEVVVTGSRIERAGFDAPTPTTVVGDIELRQGNRPSIAQVLNDLPAFRMTSAPTTTIGLTSSSTSSLDLRGLGPGRTLTLLNGSRFIGSLDLNTIPQNIIKRVEVVTGGASAAWGSGAVAGVVNIILDDDLVGLSVGAQTAIASRGDAARYAADATFGTKFAGGRGHFMVAGEYLRERGAYGRDGSRGNLDSSLYSSSTGQILLANHVNFLTATPGGVITSGALAGQSFNPDGTLSPVLPGSDSNGRNTIGGNSRNDTVDDPVSPPYRRTNLFARASFEVSDALKLSVDGSWTRVWSQYGSYPESLRGTATTGLLFQRDNAFLSPAVRTALASGPATFRLGRLFTDIDPVDRFFGIRYQRDTVEGRVRAEGALGGTWKYDAYYDHGELRNHYELTHQRIGPNFTNAIDAVTNTSGQIVCRVALTDPTTACRPLNLFGVGNASPAALAYAFGDASAVNKQKLDAAGASIRGDLFSTWAGPVSIAVGGDWRRESSDVIDIDANSRAGVLSSSNFARTAGSFSVKEGFGEVAIPLLKVPGVANLDVNGAARYSDYSTSGGIWSWKTGGTLRLLDDLLLRAVYSRDIRSPSIAELYTTVSNNLATVVDVLRNNDSVNVRRVLGGNPNLNPEISHTLTLGGTFSPRFIPGLHLSVDRFDIDIRKVIATIGAQDALNQCAKGSAAACALISRDSTGQLSLISANFQNLASYKTRGIDFEASYLLPLTRLKADMPGTVRFRALATHVDKLVINDGVNIYNRAGVVGDNIPFTTPRWKASGTITYQDSVFGMDVRVRYVDGGTFNPQLAIVNNKVDSRTYVDTSARFTVGKMNLFLNVNNLFDRDPPLTTYTSPIYDVIGTYFSAGARVNF